VPSERDLNTDSGNFNYKVIARFKTDVTLSQATAELEGLQKAFTLSAYLPVHLGIAFTPLAKDVTSGISGALWLLFAAVGAVLLITCVNSPICNRRELSTRNAKLRYEPHWEQAAASW
jgi:hypothetical protein